MSASVNKVILLGKICENGIKPFSTKKGTSGVVLNMATWRKQGQEYKHTFHSVFFYSAIADTITKYAKPGSEVYVEGELSVTKEKETNVIGHEFQFVSPREK